MSRAQFARRRSVSRAAVTQWIAAGRVVLTDDGLVDVTASEARLAQSATDRGGKREAGISGGVQSGGNGRTPRGALPEPGSLLHARTRRAQARGALDTLEYRERIRELVELAEVARALGDLTGPALLQLDGMPDRLDARLAAESDQRKVRQMLTDEIDATKQAIANIASALLARFEEQKKC